MNILITGATGFLGKPLTNLLAEKGYNILALSRKIPKTGFNNNITWLEADLSLQESYSCLVEDFFPDAVIHLAWQDIPDYSLNASLENQNNTLKFLSVVSSLDSCKKIIVSGSCWEYGVDNGECNETDVGAPLNHFTWAKHSIYSWLSMICKQRNINLGWLRVFYVYGPGQRHASLIPSIYESLALGKLPAINTPKNSNDFIYIDDVVNCFVKAVLKDKLKSGIYNVGSGKATSVLDICKSAEKIATGSSVCTKELENKTANTSSTVNFWANISKARDRLEWKPEISIDEGLSRVFNLK